MSDTKINKQQLDFYKDGQGIEIEATGSESLTLKTPSGTYITMEGLLHAKQTLKAEVNTGHDGVIVHDAVLDRDTTPTTDNITGGYVSIVDKNSNLNGRLYAGQNTTGVNVCGLYVPTNTTTASGAHLGIQIMQDGTAPCGYAPTPVASAAGGQIATAAWVRATALGMPNMSTGVAFSSGTVMPYNVLIVVSGTYGGYGTAYLYVDGICVWSDSNNEGSARFHCGNCIANKGATVTFSNLQSAVYYKLG